MLTHAQLLPVLITGVLAAPLNPPTPVVVLLSAVGEIAAVQSTAGDTHLLPTGERRHHGGLHLGAVHHRALGLQPRECPRGRSDDGHTDDEHRGGYQEVSSPRTRSYLGDAVLMR